VLKRFGENFNKGILHFDKYGLEFLDIISLQFFNLEGQLHVGGQLHM
jgi:hypothetical protein